MGNRRGWLPQPCKLCGEPTHYNDQYCEDCWTGISRWGNWLTDRKWNNRYFVQRGQYTMVMGSESESEDD